jgi:hypothetical protein
MPNAFHYTNTFDDTLAAQFKGILSQGFDPRQLQKVQLWLDASKTKTVLRDESNKVYKWLDRSGFNNHATQGTPSNQPTWLDNQLNGLPVLDFNGSNFLVLPTGMYSLANGPNTVFAVVKRNNTTGLQLIFGLAEAGVTRLDLRYTATAGQIYYQSRAASTSGINLGSIADTSFGILHGRRSGVTQAISYNGSIEVSNSNGADEPNVDVASIGAFNQGTGFFLNGQIAELIAYKTSLTSEQIQVVEAYLSAKWAITLQS